MKRTLILLSLVLMSLRLGAGELNPVADPAAGVTEGNARFTVLTDRLIRMEWQAAVPPPQAGDTNIIDPVEGGLTEWL